MPGSRFYLKCPSYHLHLPFPTLLLHGISWAKCEGFKVWLHLILLYFMNHLSSLEDKTFLKFRKEKRKFFHWAPRVHQDNTVTFNPCGNLCAGDNHLHFIGWETEGPKESTPFLHLQIIPELNPCLILLSIFSPLYHVSISCLPGFFTAPTVIKAQAHIFLFHTVCFILWLKWLHNSWLP